MAPYPIWLSSKDSGFPSNLFHYLGNKAPSQIAAIGNIEILNGNMLALICSVKCPGNIILQTYDVAQNLREAGVTVIGGFHSPMERECLRIFLRGEQPIIICPARSLQGMRLPKDYTIALDQKRLLLLSPFAGNQRRATVHTSFYRNRFVAALADHILVPYAAPGSKTLELCHDILSWPKPLYTLSPDSHAALASHGANFWR